MSRLSLRRAGPDDEPVLRQSVLAVRAERFSALPPALAETLLAQQWLGWQAALTHYPASQIWLAEDATSTCVGHALTARNGTAWTLVDMGIRPEYRGQGLGEALLNQLIATLPEAVERLELRVDAQNRAARALYEKLGFAVYAEDGPDLRMARARAPD